MHRAQGYSNAFDYSVILVFVSFKMKGGSLLFKNWSQQKQYFSVEGIQIKYIGCVAFTIIWELWTNQSNNGTSKESLTLWTIEFIWVTYRNMDDGLLKGAWITQKKLGHQKATMPELFR